MRNQHIDHLRGVAILMVLLAHSIRFFGPWCEGAAACQSHAGYYGVSIFFVVSGFLISSRLVPAYDRDGVAAIRAFYRARFGRIAPPLGLLLVLSGAVAFLLGAQFLPDELGLGALALARFDFDTAALYIPHVATTWDPLWSLGVEEIFYVFLPLVLLVTSRRGLTWLLVACVVIGAWHRSAHTLTRIHDFTASFDQLAIGVALALHGDAVRARCGTAALLALRILSLATIAATYGFVALGVSPLGPTAVALATAGLLLSMPAAETALLRPLAWLGRASYEAYLFHVPVFIWGAAVASAAGLSAPLGLGLSIGLVAAVSHALGRLYSEPLNRLIRGSMVEKPPIGGRSRRGWRRGQGQDDLAIAAIAATAGAHPAGIGAAAPTTAGLLAG
jgi:peptidoglycan/LPS O-acetylase OafA/YrhL